MAGVALGHIHLRFAWQAWHLWHWAGSGGALGPVLVAGDAATLWRGRRGTLSHPPSTCVAGVGTRTQSFTQNLTIYTIFFVAHHLSHTTLSRTTLHIQLVLLLDLPPPPSSFLPSPSLLQHLLLIIGRSGLVGLSGPLIVYSLPF